MKFNKTVLDNGLTVLTESINGRASVHLGLHLLWGSRHEPSHMSGAAHLIEHMVFKGTKKRSSLDIAMEIESVGGEIGASTGKEVTSYTVQSLKKDFELGVDLLSDIGLNAEFDEEEFKKEKDVVLSEIDMTKENFEESVFDLAFEEIFGSHPLGLPILGTRESVKSITCRDLFELYKKTYKPGQMTFSVSGDVEHEDVVEVCKKYFISNNNILGDKPQKLVQGKFSPTTKFIPKNSEQAHVLISFRAPEFTSDKRFMAYLTSLALGGGMTSILYQKVREEMGLAYSVYSYLQCFLKEGVMSIYVGTKPDKAMDVVGVVIDEIKSLSEKGLDEKTLELYRNQLLGEILMSADDLDSRMNSIALNDMIFGEYRTPKSVADQINQIDIKSMNQYLNEHLDQEPGIVILGPKS